MRSLSVLLSTATFGHFNVKKIEPYVSSPLAMINRYAHAHRHVQ